MNVGSGRSNGRATARISQEETQHDNLYDKKPFGLI